MKAVLVPQPGGPEALTLAEVPRPFDTVVVGMGDDGHTASLFPDSPDIGSALATDADCVVQNVPRLGVPRVSLTTHSLLDARDINVLFFGAGKRAVYEAYPRSKCAQAYRAVAQKVDSWPLPANPRGHLEFFVERLVNRPTTGSSA